MDMSDTCREIEREVYRVTGCEGVISFDPDGAIHWQETGRGPRYDAHPGKSLRAVDAETMDAIIAIAERYVGK